MLACADQYCPSNLVTTIFQIRDALYADFFTLIRLIAKCFGDVSDILYIHHTYI